MKELTLRFTETAQEEVDRLSHEMGLIPLVQILNQNMDNIPPELKESVAKILSVILEMFSTDLPIPSGDPEEALRVVSQEINLGRLLKERGIFRFYMLLEQTSYINPKSGEIVSGADLDQFPDAVPLRMSQTLVNPITGSPFAHDNEFIGWFCSEAHVSRALLFRRIMAYRRMINTLSFSLEESFNILVSKPFAIEETIRMVADWEKDGLTHIKPEVAVAIAKKVQPGQSEEWEALAERAADDPEAMKLLIENSKPILGDLLREVASHDRATDAMDTVRHDILKMPEISYRWDDEGDYLVVSIVSKEVSETGDEWVREIDHVPFVPDAVTLPPAIKNDLIKRLPIKNRNLL